MNKKRFYKSLRGTWETKNNQLKKEAPLERWEIAHHSEEEFWEDYTTETLKARSTLRYQNKAEKLFQLWSKYISLNKDPKILQIGCGPEDIINHFKEGRTYSIDPLADFYKRKFDYDYKKSNLIKSQGEAIPFPDKYFDVVILTNVLDHTQSPIKVLEEIKRTLKDNGLFYFENYIYQMKFLQISKIWSLIRKLYTKEIFNIHHPFMFTVQDVETLISKEFTMFNKEVGKEVEAYENIEEHIKQVKQKKLTLRLLSRFGLYGSINYACICKKKNNP